MKEMFIKKYVDMLTKEDILKFASLNNVELSSNEVDIIYNAIKKYSEAMSGKLLFLMIIKLF